MSCSEQTTWCGPSLDGTQVVFGKVVHGMEVVHRVESHGSRPHGIVSQIMEITDCGLWDKDHLPPTKLPKVYFQLSVQNPNEEKLNPLGQIVMELRLVTD